MNAGISDRSVVRRWLATVSALLISLALTAALTILVAHGETDQAQADAERTAELVGDHLRASIQPAAQTTAALSAYVVGHAGNLEIPATQEFMRALIGSTPFVKSATLAPDNVIRVIEPLQGNEAALGLDLESIPEQWAQLEPIIARGQPALVGPFDLVQGGRGLAYRLPVDVPGSGYWGLASTVIDADAYLASTENVPGVDVHQVALRTVGANGVRSAVFWGNPATFGSDGAVDLVQAAGVDWELAVARAPIDPVPAGTVLALGTALSFVIAFLTFQVVGARQRRTELADRLATLSAQTPGMLFQLRVSPDGSSTVPFASERITDMFGLRPRDIRDDARAMWDRIDPADRERARAIVSGDQLQGAQWQQRLRMIAADGTTRWYQVDAAADLQRSGDVVMHGYIWDATAEVDAENRLRISASLFEATRNGVALMSSDQRITDVNPAFTELTGYQRSNALGLSLEDLSAGMTPPEVFAEIAHTLDHCGVWRGELITRTETGRVAAHAAIVTSVIDADGQLSHLVAVLSSLSTLRDDLITGLPSRQQFDDRLVQAVEAARASNERVVVLTIGLDHFRDVNEALGPRVGDVVLREMAQRLRAVVPEVYTVARLGGDEFAVILTHDPSTDQAESMAIQLADRICEPMTLASRTVHLTGSVGIAIYPADGESAAMILSASLQALRAAKEAGRDRYHYFTPGMQEQARFRAQVIEDLRQALTSGQIDVMFQPVIDLSTGLTTKAEALVRWHHPQLGWMSPADFIPLAEASGQVQRLGDSTFDRAMDIIEQARQIDPDFKVSVNLSPVELHDSGDLLRRRLDRMRERGIPAQAIIAEITEGLFLEHNESTERNLAEWRAAGIEFAVDDFGTGYSSLAYLQSLDVSYLKIDQSFTQDLVQGSQRHALCEAIITMGHTLGLRLIAEGVEDQVAADLLRQARCDFGQGFLFAKALSADDLLDRLRKEHGPS